MKNLGKPGKREQTRDQGSPPSIRLETKGPQRHSRVEKNNWMQLSPGTGCECWGRPVMAEDTVQGPPSACQVSGLRFKLTSTGGTPLPKFTRPRVSTLCICNYPIWGRLSKLRFLSPSRIFFKKSVLGLCWGTKPMFMSIFFSRGGSKCSNLYIRCLKF